jgi:isoquinoline 1-oxidoreductase beta subunit
MSALDRREFIKVSSLTGAGMLLTAYLPTACNKMEDVEDFEPGIYLRIGEDSSITVIVPKPEVGQGIRTALAMIAAEELSADWTMVQVEQGDVDREYGNQTVGGSMSIQHTYNPLRYAGATARAMLQAAAIARWNSNENEVLMENGQAVHQPSGRALSYGELAAEAAEMPVPSRSQVELKDPADFTIIGQEISRIDNRALVTGEAEFGFDVQLPGMLTAVVARCPYLGGGIASYDDSAALDVPGVQQVLEINTGVAVLADHTWAAMQGRRALEIEWMEGQAVDTDELMAGLVARAEESISGEEGRLESIYQIPYLAHAPMEPMNCTVLLEDGNCEVWAPTQDPQAAQQVASRTSGLPSSRITVHVPFVGGGFGRRLEQDYVSEAVEIAGQAGAPVKLVWSRQDDFRHDYFHPMSVQLASASLAEPRLPRIRVFSPSAPVRTGAWRSVDNFTDALARECFIDEMAAAMDVDPVELRMEIYTDGALKAVLEVAVEQAGWGEPLPEGWGRGVAAYSTFNRTPVAQIAEVSVSDEGEVQVERVVCAVDCGMVVNPDMVAAQMEGGIVFGLSAALKGSISIAEGQVQETNFPQYPILRYDEMPEIEVHILPSEGSPVGVGEMGVPPAAPAALNAIYDAVGVRLRRIPVRPEDLL